MNQGLIFQVQMILLRRKIPLLFKSQNRKRAEMIHLRDQSSFWWKWNESNL